MLLGQLLADIVHAALDASLEFHRNGLGRTVVVTQISAQRGTGKGWRSLGGLHNRNNLVVLQFLGAIIVVAVPIMEPVSLELNKIWTNRDSHTILATGPIAQRTTIKVKSDTAFFGMRARELPSSKVGFTLFVAKELFLAGKLHELST